MPRTYTHHCWQSIVRRIRARDGRECQYCGRTRAGRFPVDHIVPVKLNGPAEPHNLTVACARCNRHKGSAVWIPRNIDSITAEAPEWREHIVAMAVYDSRGSDPVPPCPLMGKRERAAGR